MSEPLSVSDLTERERRLLDLLEQRLIAILDARVETIKAEARRTFDLALFETSDDEQVDEDDDDDGDDEFTHMDPSDLAYGA
jgi:hypothetical protein